jgi:hypothetical protein
MYVSHKSLAGLPHRKACFFAPFPKGGKAIVLKFDYSFKNN